MRHASRLISFLIAAVSVIGISLPSASAAEFDSSQKKEIEKIVTDYLLENPDVIRQVFIILNEQEAARQQQEQMESAKLAKKALIDNQDALFNGKDQIVLGNPQGDVTLVEFLDYNCGYCKQAFNGMLGLIENDGKLRIILREWPVLGPPSQEAAMVAMAVMEIAPEKYWDFHKAMMTLRGTANKESALRTAEKLDIDRAKLESLYGDRKLIEPLQENNRLAMALKLTGTPGFVLGDEVIPGFLAVDQMISKIENLRSCGSTFC